MLRRVSLVHIADCKAVGMLRYHMVATDVAGSERVDPSTEKVLDGVLLPFEVSDSSRFGFPTLSIKMSG